MGRRGEADREERSATDVTLTAAGVTLLGVLISVGVTVAFGIEGSWWLRLSAGVATSVALVLLAAWATSKGRGVLARLANWVIGAKR